MKNITPTGKTNDHISIAYQQTIKRVVELERRILGAMLYEPNQAVPEVLSIIPDESCFTDEKNRLIFKAFKDAAGRGDYLDLIGMDEELFRIGELSKVGGSSYLAELIGLVPSVVHAEEWARILMGYVQQRLISHSCIRAIENQDKAQETLEALENELMHIAHLRKDNQPVLIGNIIADLMMQYEDRKPGEVKGLSTGFYDLDKILGGWHKGTYVIVAGRPSHGKTALCLAFCLNIAQNKHRCLIFSLDDKAENLTERILSAKCGYDSQKFRCGKLSKDKYEEILKKSRAMMDNQIFIQDKAGITIQELRAEALTLNNRVNLDFVMVDHIGLIELGHKAENQNAKISEISRTFKTLAKELDLPVVVISQLSRAMEFREKDKRVPKLSDLRDSGSLEQDSDVVIFVNRRGKLDSSVDERHMDVIVAKQRNGPAGKIVKMFFDLPTGRIEPMLIPKGGETDDIPY